MGLGQVLKKHGEGEVFYGSFCAHNGVMAILATLLGDLCPQLYQLSAGGMWHAIRGSSGLTSTRTLGGWMAPLCCTRTPPIAIRMVHDSHTLLLHRSFPAGGGGSHLLVE